MAVDADGRTGALTIDLGALARNYRRLRELAAPAECGAVVKADAYGLGLEPVARRLAREGCRSFFVASLAEGQALRAVLRDPQHRIYVFEGVSAGRAATLEAARLVPVLNSIEQVEAWAGRRGPAALHIDTGMSRLGLSAEEVAKLAARPGLLGGLEIDCVMTHLACADEASHPLTRKQLDRFAELRALLPPARTSIGASAAIFRGADHCGDLVRPGIALYGGNPFADRPNPMEPVVTLEAQILQVRCIDEACTVGYGATYDADPPARLAVVGVGYADGYPRSAGNRAFAAIGNRRVPVAGRVSMDLLCLDVSDVPPAEAAVGRWVELFGRRVSVDEVASAAGTISYEVLTRMGARLRRVYRD
ncbi:MAG TPA: alanine racemase [Gammaproteobacteria bacterium]